MRMLVECHIGHMGRQCAYRKYWNIGTWIEQLHQIGLKTVFYGIDRVVWPSLTCKFKERPFRRKTDMTQLSKAASQDLIKKVLESMLDPNAPVEQLREFFSTNYRQDIDGVTLDFTGFMAHAEDLKKSISAGSTTFEMMIVEGQTVADVHIVDAIKLNGEKIRIKVIAFYTIENGKITRVNELTHLLSGLTEDRNLGSRTSH
ncbi:nuclear transport factor 2 family protein [Phyllobacterium sp. SB3]|uniref:nuclear transport factor 2 family protein n=1 Tax=Phyllobacterium sp. SB3 TaxID=3156073 RepID=UPI0032AF3D69